MLALVAGLALSACEPAMTGSAKPCEAISEANYRAALAAGAASGSATIHPDGRVSLETAGIEHCAKYKGKLKVCRRPYDYVIRYTLADGSTHFVKVPAGERYRFNVHARPTTCEILSDTP